MNKKYEFHITTEGEYLIRDTQNNKLLYYGSSLEAALESIPDIFLVDEKENVRIATMALEQLLKYAHK